MKDLCKCHTTGFPYKTRPFNTQKPGMDWGGGRERELEPALRALTSNHIVPVEYSDISIQVTVISEKGPLFPQGSC